MPEFSQRLTDALGEHQHLFEQIKNDQRLLDQVSAVVDASVGCLRADGKLLFCGNGGSAADAQHLAAELSGRYYFDRPPLFAESLNANNAFMTAVANDYEYDEIFARMLRASGRKGDVLFALSTSGNSANVVRAASAARSRGIQVVALTGQSGGKLRESADFLLNVPSQDTPRVQEACMFLGHLICEGIEAKMFERPN